jgi:hypothetical protein
MFKEGYVFKVENNFENEQQTSEVAALTSSERKGLKMRLKFRTKS